MYKLLQKLWTYMKNCQSYAENKKWQLFLKHGVITLYGLHRQKIIDSAGLQTIVLCLTIQYNTIKTYIEHHVSLSAFVISYVFNKINQDILLLCNF